MKTRSWGMSRTCLHMVRATGRALWPYSLNRLGMYYHAQLNPDIFALKLFCQQSKSGHKITCWSVAAVRGTAPNSCSSAALGICLLARPPQMQISDCWDESSGSFFSTTAPLNETFAFLMPHMGYHKAYFYKFRSSHDVHSDTNIHRLCSPGSTQCWSRAVLNAYRGQGH